MVYLKKEPSIVEVWRETSHSTFFPCPWSEAIERDSGIRQMEVKISPFWPVKLILENVVYVCGQVNLLKMNPRIRQTSAPNTGAEPQASPPIGHPPALLTSPLTSIEWGSRAGCGFIAKKAEEEKWLSYTYLILDPWISNSGKRPESSLEICLSTQIPQIRRYEVLSLNKPNWSARDML